MNKSLWRKIAKKEVTDYDKPKKQYMFITIVVFVTILIIDLNQTFAVLLFFFKNDKYL